MALFKSVQALEQAITEYLAEHNTDPKPFAWVADADCDPRPHQEGLRTDF